MKPTHYSIVGSYVDFAGFAVAAFVDWRMAIAVLLMIWGNNLERRK